MGVTSRWQAFSLARKLLTVILVSVLGYAIAMAFVVVGSQRARQDLSNMAQASFPAAQLGQSAVSGFEQQMAAYESGVTTGEPESITAGDAKGAAVAAALTELRKAKVGDSLHASVADVLREHAAYTAGASAIYREMASGKTSRTDEAVRVGRQGAELKKRFGALQERVVAVVYGELSAASGHSSRQVWISIAACLWLLVASALLAWIALASIKPLARMTEVAGKLAIGEVEQAIEYEAGDEVGKLAAAFRGMIEYVKEIAAHADRLGQGDLGVAITPRSEHDLLSRSFDRALTTLRSMADETRRLTAAARQGQLSVRGDASRLSGGYRNIIEGVNATLDAVVGPLNVAAEYVDRISKGDMPPKITDEYPGDFNEIKNNLNTCIDAVNALCVDSRILVTAAVEGQLATRADAAKHGGDFRRIIEGFNATLDAVTGPLDVAATYVCRIGRGDIPPKITEAYKGDFNEIKKKLNQ